MTVDQQALAAYVGVDLTQQADQLDSVTSALNSATIMVDDVLSAAYRPVPEAIRDRLVLEVGHAFFKRSDSPSGSSQGVTFDTGQSVMGPKDPLAQVWPVVRRYVLPL